VSTAEIRRRGPNCFGCRHFFVTHESTHPYGCRAMGFKTAQLPAITVYANSGLSCQAYSPKES
jgi:hypothetical protein